MDDFKPSAKKGVYSEIESSLFNRLVVRRKLNKKSGRVLDSNYKLIEAGVEMILDHFDEVDGIPKVSNKDEKAS
jgi:hypothetical protein